MKPKFRMIFLTLLALLMYVIPAYASSSLIEQIAREEKAFRENIFTKQVKIVSMRIVRGGLPKISINTGIVVGRENRDDKEVFYVITASHVLGNDDRSIKEVKLRVVFPTKNQFANSSNSYYKAEFLFNNWLLEYAFLKIEVSKSDIDNLNVQAATISQEMPEILEEFWVSGFYKGDHLVANKSYLSRVVLDEKAVISDGTPVFIAINLYFIADGVNGPGMSGGGVFNAKGELVALLWALTDGNMVMGTPVLLIQKDFTEKLKNLKQEK